MGTRAPVKRSTEEPARHGNPFRQPLPEWVRKSTPAPEKIIVPEKLPVPEREAEPVPA